MFKKPRRNFRQRKESGDDDNDENAAASIDKSPGKGSLGKNGGVNDQNGLKKEKKKKDKAGVVSRQKPIATCLDDDEHEEGAAEVFKVKKSSHSRKIAKQLKKERKKELIEQEKDDQDVRVILNGDRALDMDLDSDIEMDNEDKDPDQPVRHAFRSVLERGDIPDANMIHLARKKRAQAREQGDVIPLDDTQQVVEKPPAATARLVREEDHDLSEDEDRVDFTLNQAARDRQKIKDNFLAAEHGSDESDHEQEKQWEEQQIRKAVGKDQMPSAESSNQGYYDMNVQGEGQIEYPPSDLMNKPLPETVTITQVKKQLKERLESLQQVHRVHSQERENVRSGLTTSRESAATIDSGSTDSRITELNKKYKFYQEMRSFVRDLLDCFNEKFEKITELDTAMVTLLKGRSEKLCKRRQEDIRDETSDCSSMNKVAAPASTPVEIRQQAFKQRRTADREARRSRRRRSRADKGIRDSHCEGLSSDDEESTSDILKLNTERDRIISESRQLFDDVIEEFTSSDIILSRFHQWKIQHSIEYNDAYVGLCLPKLLSPLVKLSLIDWNPLQESTVPLTSMLWYCPVVLYGCKSEELFNSNDHDNELLPSIVEKVLIPKLTGYVELVWDPMSTTQSRGLSSTIRQFAEDYPTISAKSSNTEKLMSAIVKRINKCLDEDTFMPLYSPDLLSKSSEARSFLHRQFWTSVKLLQNIISFSLLLSDTKVKVLALDSLLNRYIMLGLQCAGTGDDAIRRINAVIDSLPNHWFKLYTEESTIPQLENLCRFIKTCAKGYYDRSNKGSELEKRTQRDNLKTLSRLLILIHALDHAKQMSEDYSFRLPK